MPFEYEFFGPIGTFVCTTTLPIVVYALSYLANARGCVKISEGIVSVPGWADGTTLFSWRAMCVVYGWYVLQFMLHKILPGSRKHGIEEQDGTRWLYKLNAFQNFMITYGTIFALTFICDVLPLHWAADHFLELLTSSTIFSISLSIVLYSVSFRKFAILSPTGTSGCTVYDFWMGREMNPRLLGVDLKEFCELNPGLMGWMVLNLSMAHKQWVSTGQVSVAMVLINAFQMLYVCDAMWYEKSILTTMDITTEGFGYMLTFGDLTWVPFVYSIQARYLMDNPQALSAPWVLAVLALKVLGYRMFRGANSQKDLFRTNPNDPRVSHLQTLATHRGTKLICSGWWGVARHVNYTGDWVMSVAWCMCCGVGCVVPYFYAVYFAILLLHRDRRDDHACKVKYGGDWDMYCQKVPYRLIPLVY